MKVEKTLTSVHVINDKYIDFKIKSIKSNMNFQKLVNRCIDLYNTDKNFKNKIDNYTELSVSGSKY